MRFLILGWSVGLKKKKTKKNSQEVSEALVPQVMLKVNIHIFGLTKCTIYRKNAPVFVPVFLYAVTMLIFQIKRIISNEKWFNYVELLKMLSLINTFLFNTLTSK